MQSLLPDAYWTSISVPAAYFAPVDTVEVVLENSYVVLAEITLALDPWVAHYAQYVAAVVQEDSMPNRTVVACMFAVVEAAIEMVEVEQEGQRSSVEPSVPSFLLSTTWTSQPARRRLHHLD